MAGPLGRPSADSFRERREKGRPNLLATHLACPMTCASVQLTHASHPSILDTACAGGLRPKPGMSFPARNVFSKGRGRLQRLSPSPGPGHGYASARSQLHRELCSIRCAPRNASRNMNPLTNPRKNFKSIGPASRKYIARLAPTPMWLRQIPIRPTRHPIRNRLPLQMVARFLRAHSPPQLSQRLLTHRPIPARSFLSTSSPAGPFLISRKLPPSATHVHPLLAATKRILTTTSLTTIRECRRRADFRVGGELVSRLNQNAAEQLRRTAPLPPQQR